MDSASEASSGSTKCKTAIRVPLFILNLVTWICGGALIGLGIWVVTTNNEYKHFVENKNIFIVYITLAVVLFTAGIFGACGALLGNTVLLKMYFAMNCLVFCALFGTVVFGVIQKNLVREIVQESWNKTSDETRIFIQKKFDCCGVSDNVTYFHRSNLDDSCFVNKTTMEAKQNCLTKLVDWLKQNQLTVAIFASSIMILMVILMVSSCCLIHQLGTSKRELKRTRVVPITVDGNHGHQMTNFTQERYDRQGRSADEMMEIEEVGEPRHSSRRNEKEKQPKRDGSTRKSWAKHDDKPRETLHS